MSRIISVAETTQNWTAGRQIALVFSEQTGSTNDDAKKSAFSEAADLVLYLCAHQLAGRGRGTNTWLDTGSGECLLSTWSFHLEQSPQAITGPRVGLALFTAAARVWPSLEWSLKAPNDLYLGGRKMGGLLVETVSSGDRFRLLIGLGMNILNHPRRFAEAEHLTKSMLHPPDEGEWFQFLDELHSEFTSALRDCILPDLSDTVCRELTHALNANSAKSFAVQSVSPNGDLIHDGGRIRWIDL